MRNLTLAIATSTPQIGVALGSPDGELLGEVILRAGRRHGELLAPAIQQLLQLAGTELSAVERVAVDVGPGLFTGLRVGVATAKALASALDIPVVGCSSLDVLAYAQRGETTDVVAVVDARRAEVFWARYRGGTQISEPAVDHPTDLAAILDQLSQQWQGILATGDGARRYESELAGVPGLTLAGTEHDHPRPAMLIEVAASRPALAAEKVTPTYLRGADVRIGWEQRDG